MEDPSEHAGETKNNRILRQIVATLAEDEPWPRWRGTRKGSSGTRLGWSIDGNRTLESDVSYMTSNPREWCAYFALRSPGPNQIHE